MYFQRLEDLRTDADKTQQEIADILHCKREVYRRYEKGINEIPVWAVIQLAQYYHVSTDYILGLSDDMTLR
ncbi:MAG: helix-turn-helix domain-containing protein [Oscillospiraceae bacterium]|nr:helix-turn-helix domain-containing protein [Oscillospiraceae bacterium]